MPYLLNAERQSRKSKVERRKAQLATRHSQLELAACGMLALVLLLGTSTALAQEIDRGRYEALVKDKSPALVTVKFVLKVKSPGGERERETEVTGLMIEGTGLVVCANSQLGGMITLMARARGMGSSVTANPTDIKVLVGDDTEGVDATLLARDTELDLAWVKIDEPASKPYAHIELSRRADAKIGTPTFSIRRMGKFFDRVAVISEGWIGAIAHKPRDLFVAEGAMTVEPGLPIFTADGALVGLFVIQMPETEEALSALESGNSMQDMARGLILPAAEVAKATARAREMMNQVEE
ncbi:MAG: trypsin-like peptidase domain-containing protein [Phycisphaerae bacterium]